MAREYLYLIRHGAHEKNGQSHKLGPRLTKLGRAQAEKTALRLAKLPIDAVYRNK